MSALPPAPPPKTVLGRHRLLSPNASVRVSPLCLGGMNFGDAWKGILGECTKDTAFGILDHFFSAGGNFVDTANNYQNEQSEAWIGEWMESKGVRDQMVVATKYTTNYQNYKGAEGRNDSNFAGNGTKSLNLSVRDSLTKLRTDYIDLLYVHWWDHSTSIPELMLALNALLNQGRVLYLGASDMPAYVVAACNQYARDHALRGFVAYQGKWSAAERDFERDVLPLARDFGLAVCPFNALGGGQFKTKAQREEAGRSGEGRRAVYAPPPTVVAITDVLERIAATKPHPRGEAWHVTGVALAYVLQKQPYVHPIVGGRKVEHLQGNIDALSLELSEQDIKDIEEASGFQLGFPYSMLGQKPEDSFLMNAAGTFDYVPPQTAIRPKQPEQEKPAEEPKKE